MQVLQEDTVRQLFLKRGQTEIHVERSTYVTQQARDYIREKHLVLTVDGAPPQNRDIRPAAEMAAGRFQTEDGRTLDRKGEHMTHLHGNVLVPKNHPRIVLRGKLDSFQAELVVLQTDPEVDAPLSDDLGELLEFCRSLMCCEVTGKPLPELALLGLDAAGLRMQSQRPQEYLGVGHLLPDRSLGRVCAALNLLRCKAREVELAAVDAFVLPDGTAKREDLLRGLNRLSSALYILMLRRAAGRERGISHE